MKQIKTAEQIKAIAKECAEANNFPKGVMTDTFVEGYFIGYEHAQQLKPEWTDDDIEFAFYAGVNNIDVHGLPHIKCDKAFEMLIEKMKKEREAKTLLPNPK